MLIRTVVAPLLGTNCYLVTDAHGRCVVVDPGMGVAEKVEEIVTAAGLDVVGVLVTHGHVDHTWDAATLCRSFGVPLHVHADDADRIEDPFGTLGPLGAQLAQIASSGGQSYRAPHAVATFTADDTGRVRIDLGSGRDAAAGPVVLHGVHAPGHTPGSTIYVLEGPPEEGSDIPAAHAAGIAGQAASAVAAGVPGGSGAGGTALTGDVLFAGSVGRTDLPGGDQSVMTATLARVALLDPLTTVLPGHGPSSRLDVEVATNPYLPAG